MKNALIPDKTTVCLLTLCVIIPMTSFAGEREQAKRIHDRIAGVPPSAEVLDAMAADILANNAEAATIKAMANPSFYNVTLKNLATPWTNLDQTVFAPLNDYTATVIGMVRDDVDFRKLLFDDIIYVGSGVTPYSNDNNNHYEALEDQGADLSVVLDAALQSAVTQRDPSMIAGVMTSRAAANAFFYAGTNRAMLRYTLMNHLCHDLEQLKDITLSPDRIRQDVSRSPGGDSRIFLNNCVGCHSGMDPLAQAFAYYEWSGAEDAPTGQMLYNSMGMVDEITQIRVQRKYHINENNFPYGFVTPDDHWTNRWREGQNAVLGWDESLPGEGFGAASMGQELAYSDAFARCQVEKVFTNVCLRPPGNTDDHNEVERIVGEFATSGYKLKKVFSETAMYCMGN